MTDGIIQKIFNKYHKHYFRVNYTNIDYESLMRAIEQELIDEIRKINDIHHYPSHVPRLILEKQLIGDNE